MITAVLALAIWGLAQEPTQSTEAALANLEACVDRIEGTALCPGLEEESAFVELCMASREHNATHRTFNACIVRSTNRCFEQNPEATADSVHVQWCLARVRGGVRNAVLRRAHTAAARLPEDKQRELWGFYDQAVVRMEHLAEEAPEGQPGAAKTAGWIVFAHRLSRVGAEAQGPL